MTINLQTPQTGMDSFLDVMKQGQQARLMQAQAQQAQGSAAKSNMLANILKGGTGGTNGEGMDANQALLKSGALGLKTEVVEGNLVTPFGTFKIGESPTEKGARETQQKEQQGLNTENAKRSVKLKESHDTLRQTYSLYKDLENLLKKNPSLTGLGPNIKRGLNMSSDPDLAAFHQISTQLQAALAKLGGQRGGQAVLNWAKSAKPSAGNKGAYNMGMIKSALKNLNREFGNINREHKEITGKELDSLEGGPTTRKYNIETGSFE